MIRPALATDLPAIEDLLTRSSLPVDGVKKLLPSFVVGESEGRIVAVAGVEPCGDYGLLRSAAVEPEWRSKGVGRAMVKWLISDAESKGVSALYLLTTTASKYFPSFGFIETTRDVVPDEIQRTAEFEDICPSSATVMMLKLAG